MSVTLRYHGHACFTLTCDDFVAAIDPYKDYVPGYGPLRLVADAVYCSHAHDDHAYTEAVTLREGGRENPFAVTLIEGFHDDCGGSKRGPNTMRIFEADGLRIAHLGDIGCEPSEEDLQKLQGLDACLIPVGGFYTIDAVQAKALLDVIRPRVIVPMHYRLGRFGFEQIGELKAFTDLYENVQYFDTPELTLTKTAPQGVVVPAIEEGV